MPENNRDWDQAVRVRAYFIWEREGRPEGRADDHWQFASDDHWQFASIEHPGGERVRDDEHIDDEEKILAGRPDANIPALLTRDVRGG
jgi:Protein of unknown function (DUF2934)